MATNSMVPYSNPAGNNQMTPPGLTKSSPSGPAGVVPVNSAVNPAQASQANPLVPTGAGVVPTSESSIQGTQANAGASSQQLSDIYGQGIGGDLNNLLNSIGGVNSTTLQEYDKSLQPGFAQAGANLDASLGAGGVSANSSVAALGEANLNAQEQGMEAGENANLLQSGQNLEANVLQGTENAAATETAQSGWNIFGDVLNSVGNIAGTAVKAGLHF